MEHILGKDEVVSSRLASGTEVIMKSYGKIVYDPYRGNMKRRTKGWCVMEVDREITRYFRWFVKKELGVQLCNPAWDAHVSIVRGEKISPKNIKNWKRFDKKSVQFEYSLNVRSAPDSSGTGTFWWVDVKCEDIQLVRDSLGLFTGYSYHLTIGRTY